MFVKRKKKNVAWPIILTRKKIWIFKSTFENLIYHLTFFILKSTFTTSTMFMAVIMHTYTCNIILNKLLMLIQLKRKTILRWQSWWQVEFQQNEGKVWKIWIKIVLYKRKMMIFFSNFMTHTIGIWFIAIDTSFKSPNITSESYWLAIQYVSFSVNELVRIATIYFISIEISRHNATVF